MQINATNRIPLPSEPSRRSAPPDAAQRDAAAFDTVATLRRALAETPDVRPELVERAEAKAADETYPPDELIRRIANLFALHIGKQDE